MSESPASSTPPHAQSYLEDVIQAIERQLTHVWMVRTFLKHSDEAENDEELREIHRELYDYMLALGSARDGTDTAGYLKVAHKKFTKLRNAAETFAEIQPDVSGHMNFQMAARSLMAAVTEIGRLIDGARSS